MPGIQVKAEICYGDRKQQDWKLRQQPGFSESLQKSIQFVSALFPWLTPVSPVKLSQKTKALEAQLKMLTHPESSL